MTRYARLNLIAILCATPLMLLIGVMIARADSSNSVSVRTLAYEGGKWGADPKPFVSFAGYTFREVPGAITTDFAHDPGIIYRVSVGEGYPNLVLGAHSDSAGAAMYLLRVGDVVTVEGRPFVVTMTRVSITNFFFADREWFYKPDALHLYTCFPAYSEYPTGRLVVTAEAR